MMTYTTEEALHSFKQLAPVEPDELVGLWKGTGIPTHHPFDGVLENLGWFGKRFRNDMRADALLFTAGAHRLAAIDPARIPVKLAMRFSSFGRTGFARNLFSFLLPRFRARGTVASLRTMNFEGTASAAMIYDDHPIVDHFRRVDDGTLRGMMTMQGMDKPFFFELTRVEE